MAAGRDAQALKALKVLSVIGTRPEAIKMAPVIRELQRWEPRIEARLCVTAQHREMLDQMLSVFDIKPDFDLGLMQPSQTPSQVAARVLLSLDPLLAQLDPDWMVVQGDTTTAMAAAMAGYHRRIPVAHVEAGVRTGRRDSPFPEEANRVIADSLSSLHFAPTDRARKNLAAEGISPDTVHVVGNTVVDALRWALRQPPSPASLEDLQELESEERRILLVTLHRRESLGKPLKRVCQALREWICGRSDCLLVFPVHRNPEVEQPVRKTLGDLAGVRLLNPVDYLTFVRLLMRSDLVLTDSGGIQEEAATLGLPALILRDVTDRPEAIEAGLGAVLGTSPDRIRETVELWTQKAPARHRPRRLADIYGDGKAAKRIAEILSSSASSAFTPLEALARKRPDARIN